MKKILLLLLIILITNYAQSQKRYFTYKSSVATKNSYTQDWEWSTPVYDNSVFVVHSSTIFLEHEDPSKSSSGYNLIGKEDEQTISGVENKVFGFYDNKDQRGKLILSVDLNTKSITYTLVYPNIMYKYYLDLSKK